MVIEIVTTTDMHKIKEICEVAVLKNHFTLSSVFDQYETKGMCEIAVEKAPGTFNADPDKYKTKDICERAICRNTYVLDNVPDQYKNQKKYEKAAEWFLINIIPKICVKELLGGPSICWKLFLSGMLHLKCSRT